MIAPTNCNPDCDCAQRMVRCQRAAVADAFDVMLGGLALPLDELKVGDRVTCVYDDGGYGVRGLSGTVVERLDRESVVIDYDAYGQGWGVRDSRLYQGAEGEQLFVRAAALAVEAPGHTDLMVAPEGIFGYLAAERHHRLVAAFRACDLDCAMWSDNALKELADIAIATLEKA